MVNTYITPIEYTRSNSGQETASLLGNVGRLSGSHALGVTALNTRLATDHDLLQDDVVYLFDGSSSEFVTVTADTPMPVTSIPITATQYAHSDGVVYCTNGFRGSLADDIFAASDMVEDECLQPLLLTSHTDTLSLQTMQASISNDGILTMRPQYFPVQAITSVTINSGLTTLAIDPTQASIELGQELIRFYQLVPTGNPPVGNPWGLGLTQQLKGTVTLVYTSGFAYSALPPRIKKACVLYTSDLLSKRRNPAGAAMFQSGAVRMMTASMRDTSGESDLIKEARSLLKNFKREVF